MSISTISNNSSLNLIYLFEKVFEIHYDSLSFIPGVLQNQTPWNQKKQTMFDFNYRSRPINLSLFGMLSLPIWETRADTLPLVIRQFWGYPKYQNVNCGVYGKVLYNSWLLGFL